MRVQEAHHGRVGDELVLELDDAVALVVEDEQPDRDAARCEHRGELLRLAQRHARIVRAVDHQQSVGLEICVMRG